MSDLSDRYGRSREPLFFVFGFAVGLGTLLVLATALPLLAWLVWATTDYADPEVTSELVAWEVVDAHTATAVLQVDIEGGAEELSCQVQAKATDGAVVGILAFEPVAGRNEVTIATEREATSVSSVGCTAEGQSRPR